MVRWHCKTLPASPPLDKLYCTRWTIQHISQSGQHTSRYEYNNQYMSPDVPYHGIRWCTCKLNIDPWNFCLTNQAEKWVYQIKVCYVLCVCVCACACCVCVVWCSFPAHVQMWVHLKFLCFSLTHDTICPPYQLYLASYHIIVATAIGI